MFVKYLQRFYHLPFFDIKHTYSTWNEIVFLLNRVKVLEDYIRSIGGTVPSKSPDDRVCRNLCFLKNKRRIACLCRLSSSTLFIKLLIAARYYSIFFTLLLSRIVISMIVSFLRILESTVFYIPCNEGVICFAFKYDLVRYICIIRWPINFIVK